jgi:hypothetical protein
MSEFSTLNVLVPLGRELLEILYGYVKFKAERLQTKLKEHIHMVSDQCFDCLVEPACTMSAGIVLPVGYIIVSRVAQSLHCLTTG